MRQPDTPFLPAARADLPRRTPPRLGPILALVGVAVGIGLTVSGTVLIISTATADDDIWAPVPVDGAGHRVDVPADSAAVIWNSGSSPVSCEIADAQGAMVGYTSVSGFENRVDGVTYRAVSRFVTTTEEMIFTCTSSARAPDPVLVGKPPHFWDQLSKIAGLLAGFAVLLCGIVVTALVLATGAVGSAAHMMRRQ